MAMHLIVPCPLNSGQRHLKSKFSHMCACVALNSWVYCQKLSQPQSIVEALFKFSFMALKHPPTTSFLVLTQWDWRATFCTTVVLPVQSYLGTDAELILRLVADLRPDARLGNHVHTLTVATIVATWNGTRDDACLAILVVKISQTGVC